ncbi:MAG: ABC transporter substrate-binding protein [Rhodospirillaceae bacterium]|jgi:branched-chain amino acid transport system substrate-binding protein|nr:ABC transporter substrate-binding protein [Rhodospirillaceae bacterium]MBT4743456.1 ABC transporter substrate-binding protein [Rhodospirillaceae bacterium]MBT5131111.1 ABC transporter substrate-binding protein [Rhodospirillaceae bacterium]MBT6976505.1 ABC transporter substrate-binding protein [Rhodospirillaceae bacterium]
MGSPEPNRKTRNRILIFLAVIFVVAIGLFTAYLQETDHLGNILSGKAETLRVAVVLPPPPMDDDFLEGITMAVNDVNRDGGIDGRPLEVLRIEESAYTEDTELERIVADTLELASHVARKRDLLAVIGHHWSDTAIPASSIYNRHKILYLSSHATAPSLTNHDFSYVFALQPDSKDMATIMAHHVVKMGLRKFVVLSDDTSQAKDSAGLFRSWLTKYGGNVVYDGSLANQTRSIDRLLASILDNSFFTVDEIDGFFVNSLSSISIGRFIKRARELGLNKPIIGTDAVLSPQVEQIAGKKNMRGVSGVSLYDQNDQSSEAKNFLKRFKAKYDKLPDSLAAVGYDAIRLLQFTVAKIGSVQSTALADKLRIMRFEEPFSGVTGPLAFDENGLVTNTEIYIVSHDGKAFNAVAKYKKPLDWDVAKTTVKRNSTPVSKEGNNQ